MRANYAQSIGRIKMENRIYQAAIGVLKEYEAGISVKQMGDEEKAAFSITVRGIPDEEAAEEIKAALYALDCRYTHQGISVAYGPVKDTGKYILYANCTELSLRPNLKNSKDNFIQNAVGNIAMQLAEGGVNFPGSARFRAPQLGG
jgi:hypothetical protein